MTANHVITTRKSKFREYASDITVTVVGNPALYSATPVIPVVSADQTNYDSALLKIKADKLPQVTLGDLATVSVGDPVTIIPTFPSFGCMLLEGTVAAKGLSQNGMGPNPVSTIIFQSPIRNGFSGSPIFDSKGKVVGIEDTKVFGISPALDVLRAKWAGSSEVAHMAIVGIDIGGSFTEIINNLDQNLISGLGSGVDISYAKQEQDATKKAP
jgi:S1-C subfamily serine protease